MIFWHRQQTGSSLPGQLVIFGAPIVLADRSLRLDPPAAFRAVRGQIEGTLLDLDRVKGDLLPTLRDRPPMSGSGATDFRMSKFIVPAAIPIFPGH